MNPCEAAKVLSEHNLWRKGQLPFEDMPYSPQIVGEAIDSLLLHFKQCKTCLRRTSSKPKPSGRLSAGLTGEPAAGDATSLS